MNKQTDCAAPSNYVSFLISRFAVLIPFFGSGFRLEGSAAVPQAPWGVVFEVWASGA
ncbi:hypothetical protein DM02DRAFT_618645 [Periconia macrospinosa]|uniref:Uncharacterized protein n=1 Tax=Periconia macrospinosa TaxID=97972 RepID=A0A2V1D8F5_9PLEO|nr:hypothetical protein DM02DRAFT_618645 [Periconia macrospinosa]